MVLNDEIGYFESKKILKEFEWSRNYWSIGKPTVFARNMDKRDA